MRVLKPDFKMRKELLIGLQGIIFSVFFLSGVLNFEGLKPYLELKRLHYISLHENYFYDSVVYLVVGFKIGLIVLALGTVLGLFFKKSWGWYSGFVFTMIQGVRSLFDLIYLGIYTQIFIGKFGLIKAIINNLQYIVYLFVWLVLMLFLFDGKVCSLNITEKKHKVILTIGLCIVVVSLFYFCNMYLENLKYIFD